MSSVIIKNLTWKFKFGIHQFAEVAKSSGLWQSRCWNASFCHCQSKITHTCFVLFGMKAILRICSSRQKVGNFPTSSVVWLTTTIMLSLTTQTFFDRFFVFFQSFKFALVKRLHMAFQVCWIPSADLFSTWFTRYVNHAFADILFYIILEMFPNATRLWPSA